MSSEPKPRLSEAFEQLDDYRNDGEEPVGNLEFLANQYSVPAAKLRERAEAAWGAPLETDRQRNAAHYEAAEQRLEEWAKARAYGTEVLGRAKERALDVWRNCSPDGAPDWRYCADKFVEDNKVADQKLAQDVRNLFLTVGRDFQKAVSIYKSWLRN